MVAGVRPEGVAACCVALGEAAVAVLAAPASPVVGSIVAPTVLGSIVATVVGCASCSGVLTAVDVRFC
jgi:hypothetical protein